MLKNNKSKKQLLSLVVATAVSAIAPLRSAHAGTTSPVGNLSDGSALLPTGQIITPAAAPGSTFAPLATGLRSDSTADAAEAVSTVLSPDGKTLLVLTSGYNQNFKDETTGKNITYPVLDPVTGLPSSILDKVTGLPITTTKAEWVFVYDVSSGSLVKKQQINIPNTYNGLAWSPDSQNFYVSGGIDDRIYIYTRKDNQYIPQAPFILLGHNSDETAPFPKYDGGLLKDTAAKLASTGAVVAGIAVSRDGKTLVAANFENDSISVIDPETRKVIKEIKFFVAGGKVATGEFPFDVAIKNTNTGAAATAFVSSQRDDEVLAVDLSSNAITRIAVGSQPNKMLLSSDGKRLYVANGNSDSISVIDTSLNKVVQIISLARSREKYKGSNPNALAFSPEGRLLFVTLGGENAVAVVDLRSGRVSGRIPTGWYPNSVSISADGSRLYVVNAKSNSGPNPSNSRTTAAGTARNTNFRNDYTWALEKAGISVIPVPSSGNLASLSQQVDKNNGFTNRRQSSMMNFLRTKIKHVIYIVKENRTYDQVLGDLGQGNGDPALTLFPNKITPNHHKLASEFWHF